VRALSDSRRRAATRAANSRKWREKTVELFMGVRTDIT
jgi:hypothetical protein